MTAAIDRRSLSKSQGGLDLGNMGKARYRHPIHHDRPKGAHHRDAEEDHETRTRGWKVLARIVPSIGVGDESLPARRAARSPSIEVNGPGGDTGGRPCVQRDAGQEMPRSYQMNNSKIL